jgi:hypothetical protein
MRAGLDPMPQALHHLPLLNVIDHPKALALQWKSLVCLQRSEDGHSRTLKKASPQIRILRNVAGLSRVTNVLQKQLQLHQTRHMAFPRNEDDPSRYEHSLIFQSQSRYLSPSYVSGRDVLLNCKTWRLLKLMSSMYTIRSNPLALDFVSGVNVG